VTDPEGALICPVEFRYGRAPVKAIFAREARLRRALEVEAVLSESEAELGLIPESVARSIGEAARSGRVTLERVDALERELRHDVMAITRALAEASGEAGGWVHFGATSADITETALALELKEAIAVLRKDLTELTRTLLDLADRYRATPEVGRTHGQHAVPLSFGYKLAVAAAEVFRHRQRLDEASKRVCAGKIAGAVGTGAGFGPRAADVEEAVMRRLGLVAEEAPTQIVGRDRLAEFTNLLALMAGTTERLATELRNLQRTEIGELSEPFEEAHQVGSSTMAQKRNPVVAENVTSLARLLRAFALPPLENMALWHERDLSNSANERIVVPHAVVLTDDTLSKLTEIFARLKVHPDRMASNLASSGGAVMSENAVLRLTEKGLPRSEAHALMLRLTAEESGSAALPDRVARDPTIQRYLRPQEVSELFRPERYVEAAAVKTDRIVARIRPLLNQ
jgi:adenylosuccinate lyase